MVLPDEDAADFVALEAALIAELAPVGTLPSVRIVLAAWRLGRTASRPSGSATTGVGTAISLSP